MKPALLFAHIFLFTLLSCNHIQDNASLDQEDIQYLRSLHLLDSNETVFGYYSEYKNKVAGNFFTDKRIATYWIDERDPEKNKTVFAYYPDIARIDTIYNAGLNYTPYMLVTKNDNTQFKVSVDGSDMEVKSFFEEAMKRWQRGLFSSPPTRTVE